MIIEGGLEMPVYDVIDVCNYVIGYCNSRNYAISNLRLQKLLYFIRGTFLERDRGTCFSDHLEAWALGPVCPKAYSYFKVFASQDIPVIYSDPSVSWTADRVKKANAIISEEDKELINFVIEKLHNIVTSRLVDITHKQRPWQEAYNAPSPIISDELIREEFKQKGGILSYAR